MNNEFEERVPPDAEFDEYLGRGTEVSRRYRELGARAVPPALDAKVLGQAQQQAQHLAETRRRARRTWLRWSAPLALAATVLIAVSVVLQPGVQDAAAPAAMAPSVTESTSFAPPLEDEAAEELATPLRDAASVPAAEAQSYSPMTSSDQFVIGRSQSSEVVPRQSSSALTLSSTNADRDKIYVQQPPALPQSPDLRRALPMDEGEQRISEPVAIQSTPAIAARRAAAEKSPAKAEPQRARESEGDADTSSGDASSGPSAAAAPLKKDATLEQDRGIAPEVWVTRIREARAAGRAEQAADFLERLRSAHPSFKLPADIAPPAPR